MALRYCFEEDYVKSTLARSKPSDLAVIDSDGISKAVIQAAAISKLPMHTCDLIQADGILLARQCYVHEQTTEEEPTE